MYPLEEIMKIPVSLDIESSISQVMRIMVNKKISRVLLKENQKITSITTEKDIIFFLLNDQSEKKLEDIPIKKMMRPLISISESTSIKNCAKKMIENEIGSLTVTERDEIVGIVTKTDLIEFFAKTMPGKKIVGEYMSPYYEWAYSDTPLYEIVAKMLENKISRLILRNHDEIPVGILSYSDLFRLSLTIGNQKEILDDVNPSIPVVFPRKGFVSKDGFGGIIKAEQIMKGEIITINYDDDLSKASQILIDKKISGVGVLSSHGVLIGILSKTDIIKAIAFLN